MNGIVRAALYARVSSQKQADERTIDSQCEAIRQRICDDGFYLSKGNTFCDDGYSGAELLRPALEILRDRIAASLIDRLYIHSPDRLARKLSHQALLLEEFRKHDCEIIFCNQIELEDSPEANLLIQMQGMIAEYETEKILERTRRGRRYSAAAGNVSVFGCAPYGYRYIKKSTSDGPAQWVTDEIESDHVRLMFRLVDEEHKSLGAIQRELAKRSILTRTGKAEWDRATIRGVLTNPAYYGKARYGKTRLTPRKAGKKPKRGDPSTPRQPKVSVKTDDSDQIVIDVPSIIDEALFMRVSEKMKENQKRQRERTVGAKYLLSGLLICGECGSAYCSQKAYGDNYYYRCIGTDKYRVGNRAICANRSVKGAAFEGLVWSEVCDLLQDPSRLQDEITRRRTGHSSSESQQHRQERDATELKGRIDRLINAYTNGHITADEFASRITPLRERHDRAVTALASLRGQLAEAIDMESAELALRQLGDNVKSQLQAADSTLQRQLIKLLVKTIEVHAKEIHIVYKVPLAPFEPGPDKRGQLQHCLSLRVCLSGNDRGSIRCS